MPRAPKKRAAPPDLSAHPLTRRPASLTSTPTSTGAGAGADPELVLLSFSPLSPSNGAEPLTAAERAVALGVLQGLSNGAIARQRGASPRTIANQIASLMQKLGVSSRVELVARFSAIDIV